MCSIKQFLSQAGDFGLPLTSSSFSEYPPLGTGECGLDRGGVLGRFKGTFSIFVFVMARSDLSLCGVLALLIGAGILEGDFLVGKVVSNWISCLLHLHSICDEGVVSAVLSAVPALLY